MNNISVFEIISKLHLKKYVLHLNFLQNNGSPSQSLTRQTLPSTVLSTRQTPTANKQEAKAIHRNIHRRNQRWHTYIIGLSEQYRCTLAKYKVEVTSTIKSLLMHLKDQIPDAHKTDIIYHWKCPAHNCTAEYIGETNRSLKERLSDHRIQTTSAIRNPQICTNTQKQNLRILQ